MTASGKETSFRRFSQGEGETKDHFLVMCTLHENKKDFEESVLDITVSRERVSWSGKGLKKPRTPHMAAMRRIYMALSSEQNCKVAFKVQFTVKGNHLQLICAWKDEGKDVFLRHPPFELEKDGDEGACTIVFDALLAKCESLQAASKQSVDGYAEVKALAEDSQRLVKDFVEKQGSHEEELYLKFAAVLNEKKKRIRELEQEVADLRAASKSLEGNQDPNNSKDGYSTEDTAMSEQDQGNKSDGNEDNKSNSGNESQDTGATESIETDTGGDAQDGDNTETYAEEAKPKARKRRK